MAGASVLDELRESMVTLDRERVRQLTKDALEEGFPPQQIISKALVEGMDAIGREFAAHTMFLPELIACADAMEGALEILKPHLSASGATAQGKILLGTVQGDIHDIGKNIVQALLAAAGFEVIDVGVDVPAEVFVEKAREFDPDVIALSALLSSAVSKIAETMIVLRDGGVDTKVIIGGAATSQVVADEVGADSHAKDAWEGVQKVRELVGPGRQQ